MPGRPRARRQQPGAVSRLGEAPRAPAVHPASRPVLCSCASPWRPGGPKHPRGPGPWPPTSPSGQACGGGQAKPPLPSPRCLLAPAHCVTQRSAGAQWTDGRGQGSRQLLWAQGAVRSPDRRAAPGGSSQAEPGGSQGRAWFQARGLAQSARRGPKEASLGALPDRPGSPGVPASGRGCTGCLVGLSRVQDDRGRLLPPQRGLQDPVSLGLRPPGASKARRPCLPAEHLTQHSPGQGHGRSGQQITSTARADCRLASGPRAGHKGLKGLAWS